MRKRNLHKGDIVVPIEDGEPVGFAIYVESLVLNGVSKHVVLDTVVISKDEKVTYSVAEYEKVLDLKESPEVIVSLFQQEGMSDYETR